MLDRLPELRIKAGRRQPAATIEMASINVDQELNELDFIVQPFQAIITSLHQIEANTNMIRSLDAR
jgi:hypothetical protein